MSKFLKILKRKAYELAIISAFIHEDDLNIQALCGLGPNFKDIFMHPYTRMIT